MLDFDISFFEEETRRGKTDEGEYEFTIPAFMKHAWASQLEMLSKVDMICKENNIQYFVDWGSLLGTIRHKGYIPWDDDIDLCMKRADLNRFCEVVDNYDGIIIHTNFNTADHGAHAARVMNSTVFTIERDVYKDYHGFPFPVGLDVFPLDYVPRDKALEEEQVEATRVCSTAVHEKQWLSENNPSNKEYVKHLMEYQAALSWLEDTCNIKFSQENPSEQEILILKEEISGLYTEEESDYLTEMPCLGNGRDYYIPKEYYDKATYMPFENTMVPVPDNYDFILRKKYGDNYMTPLNISAGHDYPFYNTFIRAIFDERKHKTFEGACEYIENISSKFYINFLTKTCEPTIDCDELKMLGESTNENMGNVDSKRKFLAKCEVLEEFKRLCESISIPYYAIDETLAIATGSDDDIVNADIHVAIRRGDLNDFLLIIGQELGAWFNYSTLYSNEMHDSMRIIIKSDSYLCDPDEFAARFHGCSKEVAIDIAVIDVVSDDASKEEVRKMLIENLIMTSKSMPTSPPYNDEILGIVDEWKKIAQIDINTEVNLRREFLRAADNVAGANRDENASKVRITADLQDGVDSIYDKSIFEEATCVPYGPTKISIPAGYGEM